MHRFGRLTHAMMTETSVRPKYERRAERDATSSDVGVLPHILLYIQRSDQNPPQKLRASLLLPPTPPLHRVPKTTLKSCFVAGGQAGQRGCDTRDAPAAVGAERRTDAGACLTRDAACKAGHPTGQPGEKTRHGGHTDRTVLTCALTACQHLAKSQFSPFSK